MAQDRPGGRGKQRPYAWKDDRTFGKLWRTRSGQGCSSHGRQAATVADNGERPAQQGNELRASRTRDEGHGLRYANGLADNVVRSSMTRTEGSGVLLWWQMPTERRRRQTKEEIQSSAQYEER